MSFENQIDSEKNIDVEKKESFPPIDVKESLAEDLRSDIDQIEKDPLFSAIAYPDDKAKFEEMVDMMDEDLHDSSGNKIERRQIERMIKYAQLSFLVDKAVSELVSSNAPMELKDFKDSLLSISSKTGNVNRFTVAYASMLHEYEIDRRIQEKVEQESSDAIDLLEQHSIFEGSLKKVVKALKFIKQGIVDGTVVSRVEGVSDLEDTVGTVSLPFADVIIHDSPGLRFKYVGDEKLDIPDFIDGETGKITIEDLQETGYGEALIYSSPKEPQGRYLVISHSGRGWYNDPEEALGSVRHEVEHVVNRIINRELRGNQYIDFYKKSLSEQIKIQERSLMDELDAWCAGGGPIYGIEGKAYYGRACRMLDRSVEINNDPDVNLVKEFKIKWNDAIYLLRRISEMIGKDRAGILMVHHIVSRTRNVDEVLENLKIFRSWLSSASKQE